MFFISIFTIFIALSISAVAAFYSIVGLTAIFPASIIAIIIMGIVLEFGKITTAIWLHTFWQHTKWWLKLYLSSALIILMFITSIGIFGFLTKSHIEHTTSNVGSQYEIQVIDQRINRQETVIDDAGKVIAQLDEAVNILADAQRIRGQEGAIATRERQSPERKKLNEAIDKAYDKISKLNDQKAELQTEQAKIEAEVGPIRYVAEMIYGPNPENNQLEEAVRYLIIIIVFVFDPLAVCLIIAAVSGLRYVSNKKTQNQYQYQHPQPTGNNNNPETPSQYEGSVQRISGSGNGWLGQK